MNPVSFNSALKAKRLSEDGALLVSRAGVLHKGSDFGDWARSSSSLTCIGQVILLATLRSGNGLQFGRFGFVPSLLVAGRTSLPESLAGARSAEEKRMDLSLAKGCRQQGLGKKGQSRIRNRTRLLPCIQLQAALRLRPRRAVSSAEAKMNIALDQKK